MKYLSALLLAMIGLTLAACGGADGGIASAPPPPAPVASPTPPPPTVIRSQVSKTTPLSPTPAIITGTYNAIAVVSGAGVAPTGAVRVAVDTSARTYNLTINAGTWRPPISQFPYSADLGMKRDYIDTYSDGTTKPGGSEEVTAQWIDIESRIDDKTRQTGSFYIIGAGTSAPGGRHVSLGSWAFEEIKSNPDGSNQTSGRNSGYLVFGSRTAPGDIPASGTAQYAVEYELGDATDCEWSACVTLGGNASLSVDFAARRIAATFAHDFGYDFFEGPAGSPSRVKAGSEEARTTASGSSAIANDGGFDIALTGTGRHIVTRLDKVAVAPVSVPVSGRIAGAFFGPQAGEIGGVYSLPSASLNGAASGPSTMVIDQYDGAFTAVRAP